MSHDWPLWEVFVRTKGGLSHRHVGSVHAPDSELALRHARDTYTRRQEGVSLWTVSSAMTMQVLGKVGSVGRGMAAGVKIAGGLFQVHILEHYAASLRSVRDRGLFDSPQEVEEALNAAAAVGDDRIQQKTQGRVDPESFTHGTSAQRVEWFRRGFDTGDPNRCTTFSEVL